MIFAKVYIVESSCMKGVVEICRIHNWKIDKEILEKQSNFFKNYFNVN